MNPGGVLVTLDEIYAQVKDTDNKVDKLATAVGDMVAINKRLDQHHDRLNDHGTRLSVIETSQAVQAAVQRPKPPWYAVVGGIAAVVAGIGGLFGLIAVLGQVATALN